MDNFKTFLTSVSGIIIAKTNFLSRYGIDDVKRVMKMLIFTLEFMSNLKIPASILYTVFVMFLLFEITLIVLNITDV